MKYLKYKDKFSILNFELSQMNAKFCSDKIWTMN